MAANYTMMEQRRSEPAKSAICMGSGIPPNICSRIEQMIHAVQVEFGTKTDELFTPVVVRMDSRRGEEFEATKKPGVYVFIDENGLCLKVGKSQSNASKRAMQHCGRDNTSSKDGVVQMAQLLHSDKTYLLVFALQDAERVHWILALEHYLEKGLTPKISSKRNG